MKRYRFSFDNIINDERFYDNMTKLLGYYKLLSVTGDVKKRGTMEWKRKMAISISQRGRKSIMRKVEI